MTRSEYSQIVRRLTEASARHFSVALDSLLEIARRVREEDAPSAADLRRMQRRADEVEARLVSAKDQYEAARREVVQRGFSPDPEIQEGRP